MHSFLFRDLQLITVLVLIHDSYMSRNTTFISLKPSIKVYIFVQQKHGFKTSHSFQNQSDRKPLTVLLPEL